jgi:hypothetical protein
VRAGEKYLLAIEFVFCWRVSEGLALCFFSSQHHHFAHNRCWLDLYICENFQAASAYWLAPPTASRPGGAP